MFEKNVKKEQVELSILPGNTLGMNQLIVQEELNIPGQKPDVGRVNQIIVEPEIENIRVVPIKDLRCGQISLKVIVEGVLYEKVVYTACRAEQKVHTAEFAKPFYGYVLLDFDIKKRDADQVPVNELAHLVNANVIVEDLSIAKSTGRSLTKFLTLLITVTGNIDEIIDSIC